MSDCDEAHIELMRLLADFQEATKTSLEKEEKLIRELEEEIKNLKGTKAKSRKRSRRRKSWSS